MIFLLIVLLTIQVCKPAETNPLLRTSSSGSPAIHADKEDSFTEWTFVNAQPHIQSPPDNATDHDQLSPTGITQLPTATTISIVKRTFTENAHAAVGDATTWVTEALVGGLKAACCCLHPAEKEQDYKNK